MQQHPDWRKVQRYVLAVFYYSTNGDEWGDYNTGWLSDESECTWSTAAFDPICNDAGVFTILAIRSPGLGGTLPTELVTLLSEAGT